MSSLLKDATATLNELLRMHDLNQELLETLQVTMLWLRDYTEKKNLPLPNGSTYNSLIRKTQALIDELTSSDEISQRKSSDEDFTEPGSRLCASTTCQSRRRQLYRKVLN